MRTKPLAALLLLPLAACGPRPADPVASGEPLPTTPVRVRMVTTAGDIELELDPAHAPIGVANFLHYARRGDYGGTIFHRTVPGFVIQGGGFTQSLIELPGDAPIKNEWKNGLKNARGTIGWARDPDPDTATRQWYINLSDNARLDTARPMTGNAGYAVFGRVVSGMDLVDKISTAPTYDLPARDLANIPTSPVTVLRVDIASGLKPAQH